MNDVLFRKATRSNFANGFVGAATALLLFVFIVAPASATGHEAIAREKRLAIEANLDERARGMLRQALSTSPSAATAEGLGHALLMRRYLALAAWMFASAVERDAARPGAVTALGVTLAAGATSNGKTPTAESDLVAAVALQREAVRQLPNAGIVHHNLGTALFRLAKLRGLDRALLEEARKSLREAARLKGRFSPHIYVRLAEVLATLGDTRGAEQALQRAFGISSTNPVLLTARHTTFKDMPLRGNERICKVDFRCNEACPSGITGRVMRVTCEMENSSALSACMSGEPYPQAYDCTIQKRRFGIMIPGLDPGFSILGPYGSLDVILQGDGRVDFRFKLHTSPAAALQASLGVDGSYNARSGAVNWDIEGGYQLNLFDRASPAITRANIYDAGVQASLTYSSENNGDPVPLNIEVGRGTLISE